MNPHLIQPKGLSTLINLGNSCYINVCLQVLGNTYPLREYIVKQLFRRSFNNNEPESLKTKFVTDYFNLMHGMYGDGEDCVVQPITFRNTLIRCVEQFSGYRQQDAHECIIFILQLLHNGLGLPIIAKTIRQASCGKADCIRATDNGFRWAVPRPSAESLKSPTLVTSREVLVALICSRRSAYLVTFLMCAASMPSSAGQVSSSKITVRERADQRIMSGRAFVGQIVGGKTIGL